MAFSRICSLGALSLLLWGCGGGDGDGADCDPIAATLVSRIEVTPSSTSVADGESVQLTAAAFSCDGSQLTTPTFTWQSADATTVSVSTSGMAVGVKLGGPVAISATAQGKTATAQVAVVARAVATVRVEPSEANVAVGRTSALVAKAFDTQGNELPARAASWSSDNEAIVTVAQTGAITGVSAGGPVTVTATIEGHSGSAQVSVVDAAVATVTVTPATTNVPAGSTVQLSAVLKDDEGNVLTGRAITWSTSDGTRASVSTSGVVTGLQLGGPVTILATSEGRSGSSQVTVVPGTANRLAFLVQPSTVAAGVAIAPDVKVEVRDAAGNRVPTSAASITVALGANPGSGVLSGTRTVNAVAGVATFPDLRINRAATGYTLTAAAPGGLSGATSGSFNVTPGAAASLRFSVQPSDVAANTAIDPAVQVELLDSQGNLATGSTAPVSLALGNNPGGATLGGTTTVAAVAGVATFPGLNLNKTGSGYTLVASGLPSGATSAAFSVTSGAAASLAFVTPPSSIVAGATMAPPVQVEVRDAQGNLVTNPETSITLVLGDNPGSATLGGTLTVTTVNGVASFGDLTLDVAAAGYTLVASGASLFAPSAPFDVTPGAGTVIGFAVQPGNIRESAAFTPDVAVEVRDAKGNRATGFVGNVSLQLRSPTGGGAGGGNQLLGGGSRPFVQGLAVFTGMTVNFTGIVLAPRSFTLRTQGTIAVVSSSTFTVTP